MLEVRKTSIISSLVFGLMVSSIYLVTQVYDFRVTFSEKDKVNNKYESLSFKFNLLLNEVEYFRNQLTIRKVATEKLGMRSPSLNDQILVTKESSKK
jgi:cell division protein FtsL